MRIDRFICFLIAAVLFTSCLTAANISKEEFNRLRQVEKVIKSQISEMESEFKASKTLEKYKKEYLAAVPASTPKALSEAEMARKLAESPLVLIGDEHTTDRSQQNTIMVLKLMKTGTKPVTLVIEWIDITHQADVDSFLAGKTALKDLRAKTGFDKLWGFSWASYSKVLNAARSTKTPVLLVERLKGAQKSLYERDDFITATIGAHAKKNPDMRYLVAYGDYHILGKDHLSDKLAKAGFKNQLCLIGEAGETWWKLLGSLKDPAKIGFAALSNSVYYIFSGSPLERSLSYRNYLMKMLGYKKADFDEWIGPADIVPLSSAAGNFNQLHRD